MTKKVKKFPKLEKCIFCGGKAEWRIVHGTEHGPLKRYNITCTKCGARLAPNMKEAWVVGWWNSRGKKRLPALAGCPLCGQQAELVAPGIHDHKWYARCRTWDVCGITVGPFDTAEEAADFWNRAGDVEEDEKWVQN